MIHDKLTLLTTMGAHPPGTRFRVEPAIKVPGTLNAWIRCEEHMLDRLGAPRTGRGIESLLPAGVSVTAYEGTVPCPWCEQLVPMVTR